MVEEIVSYMCSVCRKEYKGDADAAKKNAEECEEKCMAKLAQKEVNIKEGQYYYDRKRCAIHKVKMMRYGVLTTDCLRAHRSIGYVHHSNRLSDSFLKEFRSWELVAEDDVPDILDEMYRSKKDSIIRNAFEEEF